MSLGPDQTPGEELSEAELAALWLGVEEINTGRFFEAHETIEEAWTHCSTRYRPFLQAIIHVAVGCHHARNGNQPGMERQLAKAHRKLAAFQPSCGDIDTGTLGGMVEALLRESAAYANGTLAIPLPLVFRTR
ncbi:MAG: DUF309 domain-containing protein [Bryobacterales bacterium]|nr:DUF309 domain-containing protein [Bryobacterales bacterium]